MIINRAIVDPIADAVLYEGYILYPYRPSLKNRQRWTFGGLYPDAFCQSQRSGETSANQTECLIAGTPETRFEATVRFLHLTDRKIGKIDPPLADWPVEGEPSAIPVDRLVVGDTLYQSWQEAEEREVNLEETPLGVLAAQPFERPFAFAGGRRAEPLRDESGKVVGTLVREQQPVSGVVMATANELEPGLYRLTLRIENRTPTPEPASLSRDGALLRSLVSTHAILGVAQGEFVSMFDPPERWRTAASACRNVGTWPVLVGSEGQTDTMLSSPIILYDYPQVAPESPGNFFDGTEMDEMLTLRVLTMTDEEKQTMAAVDNRASALLSRVENLARGEMASLHGTVRGLRPVPDEGGRRMANWDPESDRRRVECIHVGAYEIRQGDRVRLRPRGRADIMDMALAGMTATVEAIEQDFEGRVFLAVTIDDDPGKDLGLLRQPGHRFFFQAEEVEPLSSELE